MIAERLETIH